ncbi:DNA-processing protein DprA [Bifidobacterium sp.]|jgi:DNA processing protein|uniref:DNA-processing protein DprA n=1 Tax=Bifidobacterium sp. TaxID=41200 RepID=UPI0025BED549|nr:DNA-processing protein DprA [Bifidobacterium sp.]MCI1635935.1 DNA-protecting protein DprA [Bifidobacterium sp.]
MINQLDEYTLIRALLSYCADGPDPIMQDLVAASEQGLLQGPQELWHCILQESQSKEPGSGSSSRYLECKLKSYVENATVKQHTTLLQTLHKRLKRWSQRLALIPNTSAQELYAWLSVEGKFWIITPRHTCWPAQLNDLQQHGESQTPLCLWGQGPSSTLTTCQRPVAIVGSRELDVYGRQVTQAISQEVSRQGHVVISGGAIGADACAHRAAISQQSLLSRKDIQSAEEIAGLTVAVFAGGLNHIGPIRNIELFEAMVNHGGVLISELSPDTIPEAHRFLIRNRIIAALAGTLVVTQARIRSGALNTALWANTLCREVYAVPGMITAPHNAGCNALIRDHQAEVLTSPDEIPKSIIHQHPSAYNRSIP